ncbi:hypothetical protein CGMCC3_g18034 [Colletotrichum fructicola]|uniref:Uncharacterized protein n=2 Tax=Colletotrichum fructicola (strain Nara gc5) TaxID=1213859 RepID=A0A7J6ID28_COLFN|nr:uncharacterized protein CGMCC3_g18034 [Colletotrichum fructicola]KAE9565786.1 hypothetical protein CGMCC3_g18034 [Colletotrichum fructicola]KAF4474238.1 hypothetical protein CGGC5_v016875 [Colletotrichum fructicola Nara gc5]
MFPQCFCALLLAVASLTSAAVIRPFAGNSAYWADVTKSHGGKVWEFSVHSHGFRKFDKDGDRMVINYLEIDTTNKRLTVFNAQNAFDLTKPRLKMREILRECWTMTGLETNTAKEIKGSMVQNDNMKKALADCRKTMKLGAVAPFAVSAADKNVAQKACWTRIGKTIFVASIKGAIANFDINKRLLKVEVEHSWQGDNILFILSV